MYRCVKRAGQFGTFTDDDGPQTIQWLVGVVESLITLLSEIGNLTPTISEDGELFGVGCGGDRQDFHGMGIDACPCLRRRSVERREPCLPESFQAPFQPPIVHRTKTIGVISRSRDSGFRSTSLIQS